MKEYMRGALTPPNQEPEETPFKIAGFTFSIFKSIDPSKAEKPYRVHVSDDSIKDEYWMDQEMYLKSVPLCWYSMLLFLEENV